MNLPNKLTVFRIILVPIMVIIPFLGLDKLNINLIVPLTWIIVEAIFIIASITDKLDGHIARSRNQITTFGKFLDPIADKILVLAAMIMLVDRAKFLFVQELIQVVHIFNVNSLDHMRRLLYLSISQIWYRNNDKYCGE